MWINSSFNRTGIVADNRIGDLGLRGTHEEFIIGNDMGYKKKSLLLVEVWAIRRRVYYWYDMGYKKKSLSLVVVWAIRRRVYYW